MGTSVYIHTSPAGKVYIGIAENPLQRWANGCGYNDNALFSADIERYGWDNFKHEIIAECQSREEAERLERDFILLLDSESPEKGYNQTHIKADLQRLLTERKPKAKPQQIPPEPMTAENAYKDYLLLEELPQFEEIRAALCYIALLPQITEPVEPLKGLGKYLEIPGTTHAVIKREQNRFLYHFTKQGITQSNLFSGGLLMMNAESNPRYFISDFAPACAAEMLYSFSLCGQHCAEKLQKGGVYKKC